MAYVSKIFWNMNKKNYNNKKIAQMIEQMVNFKCDEGCFSTKYLLSYVHPKIWW